MEFFYIIRHLKSNKKYAGSRYSKHADVSNFMKEGGYTTSSKIINAIIKEEGLDSFVIDEVLLFPEGGSHDYETAFLQEHQCASDPLWFNQHNNDFCMPYSVIREHHMKNFGNENPFVTEIFKNKAKDTWLEKYGVDNPSKSQEIKDKKAKTFSENRDVKIQKAAAARKKTYMARYGVESPNKLPSVQEKRRRTCLDKYGYEDPMKSPEIMAKHAAAMSNIDVGAAVSKSKATNLRKYGVDNPSKSQEIKDKKKATMLQKFGTEHNMQLDECKDKAKDTWLEKYGVDNPSKSQEIKDKKAKTFSENYGHDHPAKIQCRCPCCGISKSMNSFGRHASVCFPTHGRTYTKPKSVEEWKPYFL